MYCWTHEGCANAGSACKDKAPGHKNEATFENKMEGSKAFCAWRCEANNDKVNNITILKRNLFDNLSSSVVSTLQSSIHHPDIVIAKGDNAALSLFLHL